MILYVFVEIHCRKRFSAEQKQGFGVHLGSIGIRFIHHHIKSNIITYIHKSYRSHKSIREKASNILQQNVARLKTTKTKPNTKRSSKKKKGKASIRDPPNALQKEERKRRKRKNRKHSKHESQDSQQNTPTRTRTTIRGTRLRGRKKKKTKKTKKPSSPSITFSLFLSSHAPSLPSLSVSTHPLSLSLSLLLEEREDERR